MFEAYEEEERRAFCRALAGVVLRTIDDEEARVQQLAAYVADAGVDATESQVRSQLAIARRSDDAVARHIPDIHSVPLRVMFLRTMVDAFGGSGPLPTEAWRWVQSVAAAFELDAAVPDGALIIDVSGLTDYQRLMCAHAIARVILADGEVEPPEVAFFAGAVRALGFREEDARVRGLIERERRRPTPVEELAEELSDPKTRIQVLRAMLQAGCVDGHLHDEEVVIVLRVAEALGVDPELAVHMVDWSRDWLALVAHRPEQ
jgi:uncharacterized tellurite resistance protein B-like protein